MIEIRIVVRCQREPQKHAKILRLTAHGRDYATNLASLLDGSSPFYIHKPGENSPIGKCGVCGASLETSIEEVDVRDAKSKS